MAGPVAGRDGEVATQDRPTGGMQVDQIRAGGVGVASEVAGDRVEQHAALVGGVAVVVAVVATEATLGGGAGDDRSSTHRCRLLAWVGPPVPVRCRLAAPAAWEGVAAGAARNAVWVLVAGPACGYSESTQAMVVCSRWS